MNVAQIKDEIRMLDRFDKIGLCRWLEAETVDDLLVRAEQSGRGIFAGNSSEASPAQKGKQPGKDE